MTTIRFSKEELYWIERTADIESSMAMNDFLNIVKNIDASKLGEKEKSMVQKCCSELIDLYSFLKELRMKLEIERGERK